jgi:hypothetical protein
MKSSLISQNWGVPSLLIIAAEISGGDILTVKEFGSFPIQKSFMEKIDSSFCSIISLSEILFLLEFVPSALKA